LKRHCILGEETLSAKWRRSRKYPRRFNFFRTSKQIENKKAHENLHVKNHRARRHVRSFTRTVPKTFAEREWREPGPLIDILEESNEIIVVSEFAGFKREDLKIHVKNQRLTLSAEALNRKYRKSLNLPSGVIPKSIRTAYKNGVLEIRLKKIAKEKTMDGMAGLENAA
jgi:HSP20 family molecular chaperone IbpA